MSIDRLRALQAHRTGTGFQAESWRGRPLLEPVLCHGPFAMSDEGQVVAALQRFRSGGMGRLHPCTNNTNHKETLS